MEPSVPTNYVLYTHYAYNEPQDFEAWKKQKETKDCGQLEGVKYLIEHLDGLMELLTTCGYGGILVLFYAPGFAACLNGIKVSKTVDELLSEHAELRFAERVRKYFEKEVEARFGDEALRFRFITPLDFYDIFGRMNWQAAQNLGWWFIGKKRRGIRYDTPKIVEAIVRLRLLGTGVPVFRLDYDVLFRGDENKNTPDLGLFKAVACCLRANQLRRDEPGIATFLFSASYDTSGIRFDGTRSGFEAWRGAFATRVFPALPVERKLAAKARSPKYKYTWDDYAREVFNERHARKFYGLDATGLKSSGVCGIGKIGANPLVSVISGAMLCLSPGAILDLPPFSNFGMNVSWIDDHLKYCLHRELRHLPRKIIQGEPLLTQSKLDDVMVQKARATITNLPGYVLGTYFPTLLWGTVMDAWITHDPLLKYRPDSLSDEDRRSWYAVPRQGKSQAVLSSALQETLEKGTLTNDDAAEIESKLTSVALQRITEVRRQWANLTDGSKDTFASIWANGTVTSYFKDLPPKCHGIVPHDKSLTENISDRTELNPLLSDELRDLVHDAIEYIRWTLHWPHIVQVVRSVEQGAVRTDLSWQP